jgi:hypothetical protein
MSFFPFVQIGRYVPNLSMIKTTPVRGSQLR